MSVDETEYRKEVSDMSKEELESHADYLFKRHKEVREASKPTNPKQLDELAKDLMTKARVIDNILLERE